MRTQHGERLRTRIVMCVAVIIGAERLIHFSLLIVGLFSDDEPLWRLLISIPVIAAVFLAHHHMYDRLLR